MFNENYKNYHKLETTTKFTQKFVVFDYTVLKNTEKKQKIL
jgi:hypothetical protein